MAAPPLANTFNGGTDGVAVSVGNSGGTSGNAFDAIGGTLCTYSNVQSHSGGMAMRIVDAAAEQTCQWASLGSLTVPVFFRAYLWLSTTPVTSRCYFMRGKTSTLTATFWLRIMTTSPVMSAADATNSGFSAEGSTPVNIGSWFRVEARVVPSATVGELQWKLFNDPDSTTATETSSNFTGLNLGANINEAFFGQDLIFPASPFTIYYDDVAVSTTDWIGPTQAGNVGPIAVLSGMGW